MKFLYGKDHSTSIVFPPEEGEAMIDILMFLHDVGRLDLDTVHRCIYYIRYHGLELPNNLVFLPVDPTKDPTKH